MIVRVWRAWVVGVVAWLSCGVAAGPMGIGNLFADLMKSNLGDLHSLTDAIKFPGVVEGKGLDAFPTPTTKKTSSAIDSDDVYGGLADIFSMKEDKKDMNEDKDIRVSHGYDVRKQDLPKPNAYAFSEVDMWQPHNLPQDNQDKMHVDDGPSKLSHDAMYSSTFSPFNVTEESIVSQEYWTRIKGIVGNMKSILEQMYPPGNDEERLPFQIFDKVIAFGDNVNVLNRLRETFDEELLEFLGHRWEDMKGEVINGSPLLKTVLSTDTREMTGHFIMKLVKQVGHLLHQQAFTHLKELDFVTELMRTSGFKDFEIFQVFELLDLPTDTIETEDNMVEGRQFGIEKSGGYGHSGGGGYGHGGGYGGGYMQTFDPFVLLAGLAFATFLAYLIYRLLSSTTGRRREVPDISLALDLSDLPDVVGNIYTWLEKTEALYGVNAEEIVDETESFSNAVNQLWSSFQADRLSGACVKRNLCDYVYRSNYDMLGYGSTLESLALTALSHLFGDGQSAPMIDDIQTRVMDGQEVSCRAWAPACDDDTYQVVRGNSSVALNRFGSFGGAEVVDDVDDKLDGKVWEIFDEEKVGVSDKKKGLNYKNHFDDPK